jgi:hypothetical protein
MEEPWRVNPQVMSILYNISNLFIKKGMMLKSENKHQDNRIIDCIKPSDKLYQTFFDMVVVQADEIQKADQAEAGTHILQLDRHAHAFLIGA